MSMYDDYDSEESKYKVGRIANQLACDILDMQSLINSLQRENARLAEYEKKYNDLLDSSIKHGQKMMGGIIEICMTPGVADAISKNAKEDKGE